MQHLFSAVALTQPFRFFSFAAALLSPLLMAASLFSGLSLSPSAFLGCGALAFRLISPPRVSSSRDFAVAPQAGDGKER